MIRPTTTQAAKLFGVSKPTIDAAADPKGALPNTLSVLDAMWLSTSAAERAAFARSNLLSVWDTVEAVTR